MIEVKTNQFWGNTERCRACKLGKIDRPQMQKLCTALTINSIPCMNAPLELTLMLLAECIN